MDVKMTSAPANSVVRIPRTIDVRLDRLSQATGRAKAYYARQALERYLEDMEDRLLALSALEQSKGKKGLTLNGVIKKLKLEGKV